MIPLAPSEEEQGLTKLRRQPNIPCYLAHQLGWIGLPLFCLYTNCARYTTPKDLSTALLLFLVLIVLTGFCLGLTGYYKIKVVGFRLLALSFGVVMALHFANAVYADGLQLKEGHLIPLIYDCTVRIFWIPSTLQLGYLIGIILRSAVSRLQRH